VVVGIKALDVLNVLEKAYMLIYQEEQRGTACSQVALTSVKDFR
jgi:hypothetical protein